jgi:hypothetical protein
MQLAHWDLYNGVAYSPAYTVARGTLTLGEKIPHGDLSITQCVKWTFVYLSNIGLWRRIHYRDCGESPYLLMLRIIQVTWCGESCTQIFMECDHYNYKNCFTFPLYLGKQVSSYYVRQGIIIFAPNLAVAFIMTKSLKPRGMPTMDLLHFKFTCIPCYSNGHSHCFCLVMELFLVP